MQKWEYKVLRNPLVDELNDLGDNEWELVVVTFDPNSQSYYGYLKRPIY